MYRSTSKKGIDFIKKFEGFKGDKYLCSGGHLTIGYGHKFLISDVYSTISVEEAEVILKQDLAKFEFAVIKYIDVKLTNNQFDSLVSFTFNLGAGALQRSTLRHKVNYGDYLGASKEFLKWTYSSGKRLNGLKQRRIAESRLFLDEFL